MVDSAIKQFAAQAESWMLDASFPFWAARAQANGAGFWETLDEDGAAIHAPVARVRVQARQTYSFALAKTLGWDSHAAMEQVAYGVETLRQMCRTPEGLYGRILLHSGEMQDATPELYDTAFALLAFSWASHAGHDVAGQAAADVSAAIEAHMKRAAPLEGYAEHLPAPEDRNQNPHMHTFEASLAQFELCGDRKALARADAVFDLMDRRFLDRQRGGLRERFASDWGPHPDDHYEVGHQYEWVWLLKDYQRLSGRDVSQPAQILYQKALDLTGPDGEIYLEHTLDGEVRNPLQRCWGLTEALKAHIAMAEMGDEAAAARIVPTLELLWDKHINRAVEGGWVDRFDPKAPEQRVEIPASTGYHVYLAFAELMRFAKAS